MKKISLLLLTLTICFFTACHKDIWAELDELDQRVTKLEELCKEMNTNITSLQTIVSVLQSNDYITGIVEIKKNGEVIGYTITFGKHDPITIYHGQDGKDGSDGKDGQDGSSSTPVIGVAQDTDGIYYWTLNGEWLLDDNGNKLPVSGTNGKDGQNGSNGQDGVTPQLKIEEGYWYVSYDNGTTWAQLGKAVGENGQDGNKGDKGDKGQDGDSMFQSVTQDENYVYFTLADGTVIKIAKGTSTEEEQPNSEFIFTITYDPNGGDGVMKKDTCYYGQVNTVDSCLYIKYQYEFTSWNSKQDGTGATYYSGSDIILNKSIILYAQWKKTIYYFSVDNTKKITFAPGNLQYIRSKNEWIFAKNQYEIIGMNNIENNQLNDTIDLFGWSANDNDYPWGICTGLGDNYYYGNFVDWGKNDISGYASNTWYTLSTSEWRNLFFTRTNAALLFGFGNINGVDGCIILPDNWILPPSVTFTPAVTMGLILNNTSSMSEKWYYSNTSSYYNHFQHNIYSIEEWNIMEEAGAVFIPAGGMRQGTSVGKNNGYYWANTYGGANNYAEYMEFNANSLYPTNSQRRWFGCSVRLVKRI